VRTAAVVRILTGVLMIALGWGKLTGEFVRGGFATQAKQMAGETWPFWRTFLEKTVVPNAGVFGSAFALGEIAVGLGLLLGLYTRVAAAGGVALMASILLGAGRAEPGASWDQWVTAGLTSKFTLLLMVLLFAADAGTVWGLDGLLARRRRPKAAATKRRESVGGFTPSGPSYL
jgi:uncharacterized membrane protein YphA (DoxX/SURF4 family)